MQTIVALLAILLSASSPEIEVIASDLGWHSCDPDLEFDSEGNPCICYVESETKILRFATRGDSGWEIVSVPTGSDRRVFEVSFELDSFDNPHIAFTSRDDTSSVLMYAYKDGIGWHIDTIDERDDPGGYISLALDSNDVPYVSYTIGHTDPGVRYARRDGTTWIAETLAAATGEWGGGVAMGVDGENRPAVVYYDWDNSGSMEVLRWSSSSWRFDVIDSDLGHLGGIGLAVMYDAQDALHVAYFDDSAHSLMHAKWDGSNWSITTIDRGIGDYGGFASIVIDEDCNPYISYFDYNRETLMYARYDGVSWITENIIDGIGIFPGSSSIALNQDGSLWLAYFNFEDKTLNYTEIGSVN
ncbi:MAG: hypothetical protein AVO35_10350 [Candidatus Aegiribacteria sp. MLS_C]|nr:MAG: hypothetical protein AVO35_10350 [Candidatus Aegiribacteria sp. MLS_C]